MLDDILTEFFAVKPKTKGELVSSDGTNPSRVSVGADGTLLVAASGQTPGVQWQSLATAGVAAAAAVNCLAWASAAQSHTSSGSYQLVALDAEDDDTSSMHDTVTNNSRIVVPSAGVYMICAQVEFASNTTGLRAFNVRLNSAGSHGSGTSLLQPPVTEGIADGTNGCYSCKPVRLAASDYVEMFAFQSSGGTLALTTSTSDHTYLSVTRIGS